MRRAQQQLQRLNALTLAAAATLSGVLAGATRAALDWLTDWLTDN